MELKVLGPLEIVDGRRVVDVGGTRLRRLCCALLIGRGDVVSLDVLGERTWDEGERPGDVVRPLRTYVSRLRGAIPRGDRLIETRPTGYAVAFDGHGYDVHRFEELVAEARRVAGLDPMRGASLAAEALAFVRGRPFDDVADLWWARPEVERLTELSRSVEEDRFELLLEAGQAGRVVPELEAAVAAEPLRERRRQQLMVALYRDDRQVDALRAYERYRALLATETGLEPGEAIRRLEAQIVSADSSLRLAVPERRLRCYVLGRQLGEGAFAVVWQATQPAVGRDVAIKQIRAELANRPDFVRRFETEAHLVARLEHPHIVPLYDYWREPDSAYLVMRLLRGGTLQARIDRDGGLPVPECAQLASDIGSALAAAHRAGVVHRDVKPGNVFCDDDGRFYLGDFGIALEISQQLDPEASLSAGSPAYASPEQLRREPVGPATDIHALGITLYEALTGRIPFPDEPNQAALLRRQLHDPIPSPRSTRPELPAAIDDVVGRATAKDPADRYADVGELIAAFSAAFTADVAGSARPLRHAATIVELDAANPYKGLRPFTEADAAEFFGRDRLVAELVSHLARPGTEGRLVTVVGPSGCGKSSVVRAGLLPALQRGAVHGSESWFVVDMVPSSHPFEELEAALLRIAVNPPDQLLHQLTDGSRGVSRALKRVLGDASSELVLMVDQFEELFTLCDDDNERRRFLAGLAEAVRAPHARLRVVLTLRADFYDRPLRYPEVASLVKASTVPVTPLAPDELERAIAEPAERVGVALEPGLVARIVADVVDQPGALPLLQYALTELYERRISGLMTNDAYVAFGGLAGALSRRADEITDGLDPATQPSVRRLFGRLVTLGDGTEDTRRRVLRSELSDVPDDVIERFGAARLLSFDRDATTREPTVEVAHEALIRQWPRLRTWLNEDRDALRVHRHITTSARAWATAGRDEGELYRGGRLEGALDWLAAHPDEPNDGERAFLGASEVAATAAREREAKGRRRLHRALVAIASVAVVALVAGALAFQQRHTARVAEGNAEQAAAQEAALRTDSDLRRLAFESQATATSQPDLAMLLAVEAYRRQPGPVTESALYASLTTQPAIRRFFDVELPPDKTVRLIATSSAGHVALELDGMVLLLDATTLQPTGVTIATNGRNRLAFSPAGDELATTNPVGEVRRWDPRTGREVAPLVQVQSTLFSGMGPPFAYRPDGSLAVVDGAFLDIIPPAANAPARRVEVPGAAKLEAVAVSPSGGTIAVSWQVGPTVNTGAMALLDPQADFAVKPVPWTNGVPTFHFADDRRLFAMAYRQNLSGAIALVDVETAAVDPRVVELSSAAVELIPLEDGGALAALGTGGLVRIYADMTAGPRIEVRSTATQAPLARLADGTILGASSNRLVELDPDERSAIGRKVEANGHRAVGLLAGNEDRLLLLNPESGMVVVDRTTLEPVSPPLVTGVGFNAVSAVALSPDGSRVAVSSPGGIELIDVALGRASRPLLSPGSVDQTPFSPDGRRILIGGVDGKLHLLDVATGAELWKRDFGVEPVVVGEWSGDGRLVQARTLTGEVRIFDAATGSDVSGPFPDVLNIDFSPASDTILAAGTELRILDARTGETRRTFAGVSGVYGGAFIRGGQWVAGMTGSGVVELFDIESGARIGVPLRVARDAVSDANVAVQRADGLYWGRPDGPVVFYVFDPATWETIACEAAGRNLTREEWEHYLGSLGQYTATCSQYPAAG